MNPYAARALARSGAGVAISAQGATLQLADQRTIVDFASGGFGYGNKVVVERVIEQLRRMPLSSRMFYSVPLAKLAQRLAQLLPGGLEVCFFGNAGTEAVEGALKLARGYHRKRERVVAALGAHHGATTGALSVCGIHSLRQPVQGPSRAPLIVDWVPYGQVDAVERVIDERTAAVIIEPVSVSQGVRVPPRGYLSAVRARCTEVGALMIADEITTGLGRTGRLWGIDHDGVTPDIVVLSGALGGGVLPIGCYVARKAVNDRVYGKQDPLLHANTTGGNPSACTAALAALDVVEQESLAARAAQNGTHIERFLSEAERRFDAALRGTSARGLLGSMRVRDAQFAQTLQREALQRGVLVRVDGLAAGEAHIGLRPPLLATQAEIERGLAALERALEATVDIAAKPRAPLREARP
jgi:putrescine aminotransferase